MAFSALIFSKSAETNAVMTAACKTAGVPVEACSDIFSAIEKVKSCTFSCMIADWAEQPEASFLLKRARESESNSDTLAIAVVDNEPTPAEMHDNRLDLLVYRPIAAAEAEAVLAKACERMLPSAETPGESSAHDGAGSEGSSAISAEGHGNQVHGNEGHGNDAHGNDTHGHEAHGRNAHGNNVPELSHQHSPFSLEADTSNKGEYTAYDEEPRSHSHPIGLREACAAVLVLGAVFCLWRSRDAFAYLAQTPERKFQVLRESLAAVFNANQDGALPVATAGSDAQQDAYFSRVAAKSNTPTPVLRVAATESTIPDLRLPLHKAPDFPLPVPVFERPVPPPVHREHAAIPESMRNSGPIERPVVVTPAQMMPVSAPRSQPIIQQLTEPIAMSEEAARARLIHSVKPEYPPEAAAQKLHGPVVLQAVIGRDGSVEDLKIVRGYFVLGRAAIVAVKQWRFQPYVLSGRAASTQTVITINF
jgi:TonB family protein